MFVVYLTGVVTTVISIALALQDDTPLQFNMLGIDLYMNSHFDDWIVDISAWRPGPIDDENWRVPDMCHQAAVQKLQRHQLDSSLVMEVAKQLPNPHFGESALGSTLRLSAGPWSEFVLGRTDREAASLWPTGDHPSGLLFHPCPPSASASPPHNFFFYPCFPPDLHCSNVCHLHQEARQTKICVVNTQHVTALPDG